MLSNIRARALSLQFKSIRRFVILILSRIPRDLERAIIFGDALNHLLMIYFYFIIDRMMALIQWIFLLEFAKT